MLLNMSTLEIRQFLQSFYSHLLTPSTFGKLVDAISRAIQVAPEDVQAIMKVLSHPKLIAFTLSKSELLGVPFAVIDESTRNRLIIEDFPVSPNFTASFSHPDFAPCSLIINSLYRRLTNFGVYLPMFKIFESPEETLEQLCRDVVTGRKIISLPVQELASELAQLVDLFRELGYRDFIVFGLPFFHYLINYDVYDLVKELEKQKIYVLPSWSATTEHVSEGLGLIEKFLEKLGVWPTPVKIYDLGRVSRQPFRVLIIVVPALGLSFRSFIDEENQRLTIHDLSIYPPLEALRLELVKGNEDNIDFFETNLGKDVYVSLPLLNEGDRLIDLTNWDRYISFLKEHKNIYERLLKRCAGLTFSEFLERLEGLRPL